MHTVGPWARIEALAKVKLYKLYKGVEAELATQKKLVREVVFAVQ